MKDFDYYSTSSHGYHDSYSIKKELKKELDETSLTVEQRKAREAELSKIAMDKAAELNRPYNQEKRRLDMEFWADAREELGYCGYLDAKGVELLEAKAYEDGHSYGYPEIYSKLVDLEQFLSEIRDHIKYQG